MHPITIMVIIFVLGYIAATVTINNTHLIDIKQDLKELKGRK